MQFLVRGLQANQVVSLQLEAVNEDDARTQTLAKQIQPLSILPVSPAAIKVASLRSSKEHKQFSLLLFTQELHALLDAGLSLVEAIETLLEKEQGDASQAIFKAMLAGLRQGQRFSQVLESVPVFTPLYIGIVRSAEQTSHLQPALQRFITYQTQVDTVRNKVKSALVYPTILLGVGLMVISFLLGYVVPRFSAVYEGSGRQLPTLSQWLLNWGSWLRSHTELALFGAGLLVVCLLIAVGYFRQRGGALFLLRLLPKLAERVYLFEVARLYLTLGMLLEGGLPLSRALGLVREVVSGPLQPRLQAAAALIQTGQSAALAFEQSGLSTPVGLRMIRVGERSGQLGPMLTRAAQFYDGEMARWIDRFTRAFEPILMTIIGIMVGTIVVLLYMPIFDLAGNMG